MPSSHDWKPGSERPKTIQIFLPDGNARSIRIAAITSRTVQAIQIPRSKLQAAQVRPEAQGVGIYFLFGEDEERAKPLVYIGEAEDCCTRLKQHNQGKDFWSTAVVVTSKTLSFTKAHAKYLEAYAFEQAQQVGRYRTENATVPSRPYLPEPAIADLLDNFDTIRILLSTLGFPLFEAVAQPTERRTVYLCAGRGAEGRGEYVEDGFLVLEGSTAALSLTRSAQGGWVQDLRDRLRADGILHENGETLVFAESYLFSSPSAAAAAVLGRHANGWTSWKDKRGRTLDELERRTT